MKSLKLSAKLRSESGDHVFCGYVYRTGPLTKNFFGEFDEYLGSIFLKISKIIICGDINIHLDEHKSGPAVIFFDIISSYGLNQLISGPTHKGVHTIDVITSHMLTTDDNLHPIANIKAFFDTIDPVHYPIKFKLKNEIISTKTDTSKPITFRNIPKAN